MAKVFVRLRVKIEDTILKLYYYIKSGITKRKYVILGNKQVGIGNRLFALANTYTWLGKENITLDWMQDHWMVDSFEHLFEMTDAPGFKTISGTRHNWSKVYQYPSLPKSTTEFWQLWVPSVLTEELPNDGRGYRTLYCLYNNTPEWAKEIYSKFFKQLLPSDKVKTRIYDYHTPADYVAVQIRATNSKGDTMGVVSLDSYFKVMDVYSSSQQFYLSCLDREVSEAVHSRYGERVHELPNKKYESMVDAVADMWHIGRAKEIICQNRSSFAEASWWWGGAKAKVTRLDVEYVQNS